MCVITGVLRDMTCSLTIDASALTLGKRISSLVAAIISVMKRISNERIESLTMGILFLIERIRLLIERILFVIDAIRFMSDGIRFVSFLIRFLMK